jgi:hypothetical protein
MSTWRDAVIANKIGVRTHMQESSNVPREPSVNADNALQLEYGYLQRTRFAGPGQKRAL